MLLLTLLVGAVTTPAVEWAAWPLLVAPQLGKADAIVVLGSGVRPGGLPTAAAEERIRYGIALWRAGYAPRVVFSGGLTHPAGGPLEQLEWWYSGNHPQLEAETYAVFAEEALRVPSRVLYLEDMSHTTYQNGLRTTDLLRRHGWRHILLVTSPAHMRRSLAVFRALGVSANPAPVTGGQLYAAEPSHRFNAWRAVVHEYVGLVYYRLAGRI